MGAQKDMSEVNAMVVRLMKCFPLVVLAHTPRDSSQKRALGTVTQEQICKPVLLQPAHQRAADKASMARDEDYVRFFHGPRESEV